MIEVIKGTLVKWTPKAQIAFEEIKDKLTRALVLGLAYFEKVFKVKYETFGIGIGGVLVQEGRPLAFFSDKLCDFRHKYSTYDKEFYGIFQCLEH